MSALDIPAVHDAMCRSVRNAGRPGIAACAISALDIALWDLKARLPELPLARLLGVGGAPMAAQLNGWVHGQHIPRVKIKIGEGWGREVARDLHRVRAARHVIGDDAELHVDANGAYTRKQAVRVGRVLAEHGVGWFEEPVSSDDLTGLRLVRDAVVCDVTAGEYGFDLPCFARMITAGAVDCLQVDATRCGGLPEFLRAAALAQRGHVLRRRPGPHRRHGPRTHPAHAGGGGVPRRLTASSRLAAIRGPASRGPAGRRKQRSAADQPARRQGSGSHGEGRAHPAPVA